MITLNKIIMSNEPPLSTDTVWVDVTAKPIIFKLWLKGQWTPIGDEMDEVADILATIDAFKKEYQNKVGELTATDATHSSDIAQLKSDVEGLDTRLTAAEGKIITLTSKTDELTASITRIDGEIEALRTKVASLQNPEA